MSCLVEYLQAKSTADTNKETAEKEKGKRIVSRSVQLSYQRCSLEHQLEVGLVGTGELRHQPTLPAIVIVHDTEGIDRPRQRDRQIHRTHRLGASHSSCSERGGMCRQIAHRDASAHPAVTPHAR